MWSSRSTRVPGTRTRGSSSGTTACSVAAGAPGSTPFIPRRRSRPRATARSSSGWSRRAAPTLRSCSTATRPWRGASTAPRRSCRTSTTARNTRPRSTRLPDYRITCIFVDKKYRRGGVTAAALGGAVDLIAQAGGGVVEGYPHDTGGKKVSVLYNGTRSLVRAGRLQLRPPQRHEELRHAPGCTLRPAACPARTRRGRARPRARATRARARRSLRRSRARSRRAARRAPARRRRRSRPGASARS